jgi:hypothetical protein
LNPIGKALRNVINKVFCSPCVSLTKRPSENQLAVCVDCAP